MAALSRIKVGQTLYSIETVKLGNTTVSRKACYSVTITDIDMEKQSVMASWNSNPPRRFGARSVAKWKINKPEPKGTRFGLPTY